MHDKSFVSILVSDLETHPSLPRLLQSVARQSEGLDRTEIIVAGNGGHPPSSESIWSAITGLDNVSLFMVDNDATPAQARNTSAEKAKGDFLLFLRPDYRLDPKYLTTAFSVFSDYPEVDIMYTDYIRMAPKGGSSRPGMVQLPDFDESLLQTHNILGPGVFMRKEAFQRTDGFRDNTVYRDWDFWIQTANVGSTFYHVNYPLTSCEHNKLSFRERAEDGRYKAMIVINNQSYFHVHTVRWALSYLRGEAWAQAFSFMVIPSAVEVTRMMHDFQMKQMGTDVLAQEAIRQFDSSPLNMDASR
ncbi:glycosyltransferase [Pseudodesulfovibrio sp. zrk46]|uniref:glycosyltransferase family 2 protein n=1 Tax=Pseudodesulfovibrio sp. zrk46 TaxID=2725288 RepID=UPI001449AF8B|nr:glycosyltransferase [Pseudodesulfovibrio sp. zrk46]QJB57993.1 glycosyltransferase [Pseudodesulfovibrio sp. zrk46]